MICSMPSFFRKAACLSMRPCLGRARLRRAVTRFLGPKSGLDGVSPYQAQANHAELSETIMEINDLRVLLDLSPRRSRSDTKRKEAGGTREQARAWFSHTTWQSFLQLSEFTIHNSQFSHSFFSGKPPLESLPHQHHAAHQPAKAQNTPPTFPDALALIQRALFQKPPPQIDSGLGEK